MTHLTDKEKYKRIRSYTNQLFENDEFDTSFIKLSLKMLFPNVIDNSDEQLELAIEGLGSNDGGVDSFVVDDINKIINILQFKTKSDYKKSTIDPSALSYFFDLDERVHNFETYKNKRVQDIGEIIKNKLRKKYAIKFHFITSYNLSDINFLDIYKHKFKLDNYEYEFHDLDEMFEKFTEYTSSISRDEVDSCTLEFISQSHNKPEIASYAFPKSVRYVGLKDTSIGIVNGSSIINLYKNHKKKLFARNVRYFLGDRGINKDIIKTASVDPTYFYYFNNGITITCSDFEKKGNLTLKLTDPQVINGAQTISSLYEAYLKLEKDKGSNAVNEHFDKIHIMVRIIKSTKTDEDFSQNITRYNNTQNKVLDQDFYANDRIQKEIHDKMKPLNIFYEHKRSEFQSLPDMEKRQYEKIIKLGDLTTIYNAFRHQDNSSGSKGSILFKNDKFTKIFDEESIRDSNVYKMIFAYNLFEIIKDIRTQINYINKNQNRKSRNKFTLNLDEIIKPKIIELMKENNPKTDLDQRFIYNIDVLKQPYAMLSIIALIIDKANIDVGKYWNDRSFYERIQKECFYNIGRQVIENYNKKYKTYDKLDNYYKNSLLIEDFSNYLKIEEYENDISTKELFNL